MTEYIYHCFNFTVDYNLKTASLGEVLLFNQTGIKPRSHD